MNYQKREEHRIVEMRQPRGYGYTSKPGDLRRVVSQQRREHENTSGYESTGSERAEHERFFRSSARGRRGGRGGLIQGGTKPIQTGKKITICNVSATLTRGEHMVHHNIILCSKADI